MYKIMIGLVRINNAQLFSPLMITHTQGHCKKVVTFVRATMFSKRVDNDWNHLPASIVEASTLNTFKNRLDKHLRDLWYLTEVVGFVCVTFFNEIKHHIWYFCSNPHWVILVFMNIFSVLWHGNHIKYTHHTRMFTYLFIYYISQTIIFT